MWLKFGCKFSSKWLSFVYHSTSAESHGKVLIQFIKMAKDAGLTLAEIASAYEDKKSKPSIPPKKSTKPSSKLKPHTTKGVKLPAKYRNRLDQNQTWTGRGFDPAWAASIVSSGHLESAWIEPPLTHLPSAQL